MQRLTSPSHVNIKRWHFLLTRASHSSSPPPQAPAAAAPAAGGGNWNSYEGSSSAPKAVPQSGNSAARAEAIALLDALRAKQTANWWVGTHAVSFDDTPCCLPS
jgi:hypothetical protein